MAACLQLVLFVNWVVSGVVIILVVVECFSSFSFCHYVRAGLTLVIVREFTSCFIHKRFTAQHDER